MNILLIFPGFIIAFIIVLYYEFKIRRIESMNKVHFYVARDKDGTLNLWFNKPKRAVNFWYGQQKQDGWKATEEFIQNKHEIDGKQFPKLTWDDEPIEVMVESLEELRKGQIDYKTKQIESLTRVFRGIVLEETANI